jgi:hypothetical protein
VYPHLHSLCGTSGKLAPQLDGREIRVRNRSVLQWPSEEVSRGNGVLNGEVDANTSRRRHGVCSIADAKQPRSVPFAEMIDLHRQKAHLVPTAHLVQAPLEIGSQLQHAGTERFEAGLFDLIKPPLRMINPAWK